MKKLWNPTTKRYEPADAGEVYICPVCGEHLSWDMVLYKSDDEIIGCECCVQGVEAGVQYEEDDEYARDFADEMAYNEWRDRGYDG